MESLRNTTTNSANENVDNNIVNNNTERIRSVEKLPQPVYYVVSPDDDTVLVGINVTINYNKDSKENPYQISWYDTTHERIMMASEIRKREDYFGFKRTENDGGGYYYFAPMNLDIYNHKVKERLAAGPDFTNEEDLIKAFKDTIKQQF